MADVDAIREELADFVREEVFGGFTPIDEIAGMAEIHSDEHDEVSFPRFGGHLW